MRSRVTRALTAVGLAVVLVAVNSAIYGKERVIRTGETIYLELAPVDPRSIMQGDYMALHFRLADRIDTWRADERRARLQTAPLSVDTRGVATLAADGGSLRIAFRIRQGEVWLGTNAYFFEEGTGARYSEARYGEFRVHPTSGEAVLVALRDADLNPL